MRGGLVGAALRGGGGRRGGGRARAGLPRGLVPGAPGVRGGGGRVALRGAGGGQRVRVGAVPQRHVPRARRRARALPVRARVQRSVAVLYIKHHIMV